MISCFRIMVCIPNFMSFSFALLGNQVAGAGGSRQEKHSVTCLLLRPLAPFFYGLASSVINLFVGADYEPIFCTTISSAMHRHLTFVRCFHDLGLFAGVS